MNNLSFYKERGIKNIKAYGLKKNLKPQKHKIKFDSKKD
jgi:hypothetical protein